MHDGCGPGALGDGGSCPGGGGNLFALPRHHPVLLQRRGLEVRHPPRHSQVPGSRPFQHGGGAGEEACKSAVHKPTDCLPIDEDGQPPVSRGQLRGRQRHQLLLLLLLLLARGGGGGVSCSLSLLAGPPPDAALPQGPDVALVPPAEAQLQQVPLVQLPGTLATRQWRQPLRVAHRLHLVCNSLARRV